jgi:tetratricopeptide (TPR) repeat protein
LIRARRRQRRALRWWRAGKLDVARELQERATQGLESRPAESAAALIVLADFQSALFDLSSAEASLRRALAALDEPSADGRDDVLATTLRQLGDNLRLQGRHAEAEPVLRRALALSGSRPARTAAWNALGILAKDTARYDEAAGYYRDAMGLTPPDDPALPALLHNIAGLAHAQGKYDDAEEPARRALTLNERLYGADSDEAAADAAVLGAILLGQNRYDDAQSYLDRALRLRMKRFGAHHYEVAVTLHSLAAVYQARGEPANAEHAYRTALEVKTATLGTEHHEVAILKNNMASLLQQQRRLQEAGELYNQASATLEAVLGPNHPIARACRRNAEKIETNSETDSETSRTTRMD